MSTDVTTIQDVKFLAEEYGGTVTSYQPRPRETCAAFTTEFLSRADVNTLRNAYGAGVESLGLGMVVYFPWIPWKRSRKARNSGTLRQNLIRLAYDRPEIREAVLPLLRKTAEGDFFDTVVRFLEGSSFQVHKIWGKGTRREAILQYKLGTVEVVHCRGGLCISKGSAYVGRLEGDDDFALGMAKKAISRHYKTKSYKDGLFIADPEA